MASKLSYLLIVILLFVHHSSALPSKITKKSLFHGKRSFYRNPNKYSFASYGFTMCYYNQTIDHFNYAPSSYAIFSQRYAVKSSFWGGPSFPILVYLGAEEPLDSQLFVIDTIAPIAQRYKGLIVFMEHRFYGESNPYGNMKISLQNEIGRGYFSSAQALADYAKILLHIKNDLSTDKSPIIVFGGSYGGMLASWFRLKYPHIALGALASSAPILYFEGITPQDAYYNVASKDFMDASATCYDSIKESWGQIDGIASRPGGLTFLTQKFNTCTPLQNATELKDVLESLFLGAAQYDEPPNLSVKTICGGVDGAGSNASFVDRVVAGLRAYGALSSCLEIVDENPSEIDLGWSWQYCSEMVMPIGNGNSTMFASPPFDMNNTIEECIDDYGVAPQPHWITTYYGGFDIKKILRKFGSNIIFSNGLWDPYSSGGYIRTIVALSTKEGSHCLDLLPPSPDDPDWLVMQRETEGNIIGEWLLEYYGAMMN